MFGVGSEVIPLNFFTKLGSENPRAKLEPKWPGPLWSSISNTVHVSTCVSTLTNKKQKEKNRTQQLHARPKPNPPSPHPPTPWGPRPRRRPAGRGSAGPQWATRAEAPGPSLGAIEGDTWDAGCSLGLILGHALELFEETFLKHPQRTKVVRRNYLVCDDICCLVVAPKPPRRGGAVWSICLAPR